MKQLSKLFAIFTCMAFMACSNQEEIAQIDVNVMFDPNAVSELAATRAATAFVNKHLSSSVTTKSLPQKDWVIKDRFIMTDNEGEPVMHVINYEGGGFVIVSVDERMDPILAYSDKGYFSDDPYEYPEGLKFWISYIESSVKYLRENAEEEIPDYLKGYWDRFTMETKAVTPPDLEDYCNNSLQDEWVTPLLSTTWGQGFPYNSLLPSITCSNGGNLFGHVYAGCSTIALAQIMKYYQYPTNYSWSSMSDGYSGQTQSLILDIYNSLNQATTLTSNCSGTGIPTSYNLATFLKNIIGYTYATQASYNYRTVEDRIFSSSGGSPVIIRAVNQSGTGHVWVCDGGHRWEECVRDQNGDLVKLGYLSFHMNWGWDGYQDGYFGFTNWTVAGDTYSSNVRMVYGIHP